MKTITIKRTYLYAWFFLTFFLIFALLGYSPQIQAQSLSWQSWVQQLRQDALAQGISPSVFDMAFANLSGPNQQILFFDRTQPEKRITFMQYRSSRIDPYRISLGRSEFQSHAQILNSIGRDYGVDPYIITAIWGMETSYGHYMGQFPVITSLATLAYESPREDYFRSELLIALHILNDGQVSYQNFRGEWAGASGYPQFMPSSWEKYAVDYDHSGHKDIWTSLSDGLASLANYLAMNGWQANQPWAIQVSLPSGFNRNLIGLNTIKPASDWLSMGVQPLGNATVPQNLSASIVQPVGGPPLMTFNNFNVLMKYNNSVFYAGAVGYLADQIRGYSN